MSYYDIQELNEQDQKTCNGQCPECGGLMDAKTPDELIYAREELGWTDEPWSEFGCHRYEARFMPDRGRCLQ